jgi:hypothetical protein
MNMSPDPLAKVLQRWRVAPPADPEFRTGVWRRIGSQTRETWPAYLRAHLALWALVALVTVGSAAYAGHAAARARAHAEREEMVVTYLIDLDPRVQAVLKP